MDKKICKNCRNEIDAICAFCGHCGAKLANETKQRYCSVCGRQLEDNASFCIGCGSACDSTYGTTYGAAGNVTENVSESTIEKTENYETLTRSSGVPLYNPPNQTARPAPLPLPVKLAIIGGAVLLCVIIGLGLYFLLQPSDHIPEGNDALAEATPTHAADAEPEPTEIIEQATEQLLLDIVQIDTTFFPLIEFFVNILDVSNEVVESLTKESFEIMEIDISGNLVTVEIDELRQLITTDNVSINMVMDKSGSMSDFNRMTQAQNAAAYFLDYLQGYGNSFVELTFFDDYVYVPYIFTHDYSLLTEDIFRQRPGGQTALYDAIYSALLSTNEQRGAKCVIVFTDGEENASSATFDDVVRLAQATGIPVYIVGVGHDIDEHALRSLANLAGGAYFSSRDNDLEESLKNVYTDIYNMRRKMYVVRYTSRNVNEPDSLRDLILRARAGSKYVGETRREYIPVPDINQGFSDAYWDKDHILEFSSQRLITDADLSGLSLAELRIARNEIFARHGRMFVDPMLNKWFYSKHWYLSISPKFSPVEFDRHRAYPLSRIETENVNKILALENHIMEYERIFPNSSTQRLADYDVSLRKNILERGLDEIYRYAGVQAGDKKALNDIERYNVELIEHALSQPDIQY